MTTPPSATFGAERTPPWLEALPDSAVLLNESGTMLAVNALWRAFALANELTPNCWPVAGSQR